MPIKDRYLWVCTNRRADGHAKGSCAEKGAERLKDEIKAATFAAGLGKTVRVNSSGCIDLCEHGIAVAVMPDGTMLGGITAEDIPALVEGLASAGGCASHPGLAARTLTREGTEAPRTQGVVTLGKKPSGA